VELAIDNDELCCVVAIKGTVLDASNTQEFREKMSLTLQKERDVVLDMSQLQFIDSSGIGAILSCLRNLNGQGKDLKICGLSKPVKVIFDLVRIQRIIEIFSTLEEAKQSFQKK